MLYIEKLALAAHKLSTWVHGDSGQADKDALDLAIDKLDEERYIYDAESGASSECGYCPQESTNSWLDWAEEQE